MTAEKLTHCHRFMFSKMMPLSDAVEGYRIFDAMEVQKVIFTT